MDTNLVSMFSTDHPEQFLGEIYEIDPLAAVRIANKWGASDENHAQYLAAWTIAGKQTVVPSCVSCRWPVLSDDPHSLCLAQLAEEAVDGSFDEYGEDDDDDVVSTTEVMSRAVARFGNTELAREAATMYPGDFI